MILDATTYFDCGLPTASDLSEQEVNFAIRTVELYLVKPRLGNTLYGDIVGNPASHKDELDGTDTMAGLKSAVEHLVYAYMLWDRSRLTRYTTVVKNDEHSTEPKSEDLYKICNAHYEIGMSFLDEVCEFLQISKPTQPLNNMIFGELMF